MRQRLIVGVMLLLVGSPLGARQSGIKAVDLPADPNIPLPLYHPNRAVRAFEKTLGLKLIVVAMSGQDSLLRCATEMLECSNAFFPNECNGMLNRIVYYERFFEGLIRSRFVEKGMSESEMRVIMGNGDGVAGGAGGWTHIYFDFGVAIHIPNASSRFQPGVSSVSLFFRPYPTIRKEPATP
jgi:hypothetical protein